MRMTHPVVQVALALMDSPDARHWGYETRKRAGVRSGVMYPLLQRMLDQGWLTDGWEDQRGDIGGGRPPRRYYYLTPGGKAALAALLEQARGDPRFRSLFPAAEDSPPGRRQGTEAPGQNRDAPANR